MMLRTAHVRILSLNILALLMSGFLLFGVTEKTNVHARTAECDQCGYCKRATQQVPDNWSACAQCIYGVPSTAAADENRTLQINLDPNDPNYNKPPQPLPGKYYTQLGCIDTGLNSFRDPSAAGGVLNFFLTYLIFPTVGTLALGTIVYGAFLLLTAQGDVMQIAQGKRLITSAMVGLIFTISAVLIVNLIGRDILRIPGMGGGTKITFVGYGTPTDVNGIKTYPNMDVLYDGKLIGTIDNLQGTASDPQIKEVVLSGNLNLSNDDDIKKVRFDFTNDLCFNCMTPPPQGSTGDRNIVNIRILFNERICQVRTTEGHGSVNSDGSELINNWGDKDIICEALAPAP